MINKTEFENKWRSSKKSIFRLEMLAEYKVPEDLILFEKWKNGDVNFKNEADIWLKKLEEKQAQGVRMQRVRISPIPIPEYIHYEIDYWKYSIKSGERILLLKEEDFKSTLSSFSFKVEDHWLFDNKKLVVFHYDDGNLIKEQLIEDKIIIEKHKQLKYKLLEQALPISEFLERFESSAK